ncbi:hypothetical protein B0H10DRAFT_2059996 [Mycena sp. CBHHK59/15]|nr:hypothetical protein B0H10DRAFT_2059996 [Mycena sp. CBHHK59/15]
MLTLESSRVRLCHPYSKTCLHSNLARSETGNLLPALPTLAKPWRICCLCVPRTIHPYMCPDLDGIDSVLVAADKYQIPGAVEALKATLMEPRFLENEPYRVFAIALHRGLRDVVNTAAQPLRLWKALFLPGGKAFPKPSSCAQVILRLYDLHTQCPTQKSWL